MVAKSSQKYPLKFTCEKCNYNTNKSSNYNKHLLTKKHNTDQYLPNTDQNAAKKELFCNCGKKYKHKQSLFNHRKVCEFNPIELTEMSKNVQLEDILEKHGDKNIVVNINNNNYYDNKVTNNNNKNTKTSTKTINNNSGSFSVQNYLNNQCKDAKTIDEVLGNFKCDVMKLPKNENDFMRYITDLALSDLKVEEYPIRCSDVKRKIFYCKNADSVWEKNVDVGKIFIKILINIVCNARCIFTKLNPDWSENDSQFDIMSNIIRNISKSYDMLVMNSVLNYMAEKTKIVKKI